MLAAAAATGDAAAFAELYERHARAIFGYCRRVLRSADEAADATHEAFVSVLERLRGVQRPIVAPRPYLFRAAHNACLRIAEGRRRTQDVDSPPETAQYGELSETERIVLTRELQDEVRAANDELSLRQREILALREVERLPYDEIAQIMGTTPNAAAQLGWRARARLRTCLRRRAFDAIVLQTLDCERALGLLELAEDPGALSVDEDMWLARHFVACPRCASNRAVLAEVGATYRSWVPAGTVPLLTLALLQHAGEVIGASWGAAGAGGAGSAVGACAGAATTTTATTAGVAAPAAVTAGTVAAASGGAASVPTAIVAAAVGLAVGTGGTSLPGQAAIRERAVPVRPPALVGHASPVRAAKLTPAPVVPPSPGPAPPAAAPPSQPAVTAAPPPETVPA
ncbi:MAG TPA: sigma-70 family RNA polymerase sigma factor, partial [Solirubrobacteraceae bacterium]